MIKVKALMRGLYLEIISSCNQKCIYCYNSDIISNQDILSLDLIKKIIEDSKNMGITACTLSGGEPLLHPSFEKILSFISKSGLHTTVISNLTLLNRSIAEKLSFYNPDIQITLDSGDCVIHNESRGKETYEKQLVGISLLKELGYNGTFNIRCNLWSGNSTEKNIISVLEFAKKNRIKKVKFALAHSTNCFKQTIDDEFTKEQIYNWVESQRKIYSELDFDFTEGEAEFGCPLLSESTDIECGFKVSPKGKVFPCQLFFQDEYCVGNVYRKSITDIVNGKELESFLILMKLRSRFIPHCQTCICQSICKGGCPAKALMTTNNIFTPDGPCGKRKKTYRNIINKKLSENIEHSNISVEKIYT